MEFSESLRFAKTLQDALTAYNGGPDKPRTPGQAYPKHDIPTVTAAALVSIAESLEILTEFASHLVMGHMTPVTEDDDGVQR